jgi:hypothetical protein
VILLAVADSSLSDPGLGLDASEATCESGWKFSEFTNRLHLNSNPSPASSLAKIIDRLAADLKGAFTEMKGFSPHNLKYMRAFAEAWPEEAFVLAVLAQITWYPQSRYSGEARRPRRTNLVRQGDYPTRMEPQRPCSSDRGQTLPPAGKAVANFDRTFPPP